jgi:hypothetical protein
MPCAEVTCNTFSFPADYLPVIRVQPGQQSTVVRSRSVQKVEVRPTNPKLTIRPEDFIWLELSMVPEVERVFVESRGNGFFQVMTVVNDRSPELRRRIFAREKAIIEELSEYEFDFDILTRMNHDLGELVTTCDKPSYAR